MGFRTESSNQDHRGYYVYGSEFLRRKREEDQELHNDLQYIKLFNSYLGEKKNRMRSVIHNQKKTKENKKQKKKTQNKTKQTNKQRNKIKLNRYNLSIAV